MDDETRATRLLTLLVYIILGLVVFVVVVGGIVCIKDDNYNFSTYLSDLRGIDRLLLTAVIGILARAILPIIESRDDKKASAPPAKPHPTTTRRRRKEED